MEGPAEEQAEGSICHDVCMHCELYIPDAHGQVFSTPERPIGYSVGTLHLQ